MTAAAILFLLEVAVIVWAAGYLKREKAKKAAQEARHQNDLLAAIAKAEGDGA